jgi:hypothetical protein
MDIVLNTRFINSLLPRIPRLGFLDNFNRTAGQQLGFTSGENRPWKLFSNGAPSSWIITDSGTADYVSGGGINVAAVDAYANNGTLSVKLAAFSGTNRHAGPAFRVQDADNHYFVHQADPAEGIKLYKRVNGVASSIASGTYTYSAGDVLSVLLSDANITVQVNGTTKLTAVDTTFQGETRHGLYANNDTPAFEWDDISFTAA